MNVTFKDGQRTTLVSQDKLISIPGTGDTIADPGPGGETFLVKSVVHHNVFNSPGEHEITVNLEKQ